MSSRRNFLKTYAIGSAALLLDNCTGTDVFSKNNPKPEPTIIATWNRDKAVGEAYALLKKPGAYALDAIEIYVDRLQVGFGIPVRVIAVDLESTFLHV